jgi:hypothetical protein
MTTATLSVISISTVDRLQLARAVASFQSVLAFDHAWTGLAVQERPLTESDLLSLPILAAELLRGLSEALEGARWLQDFIRRTDAMELREGLNEAAKTTSDANERSDLLALSEEYGDQIGTLAELGAEGLSAGMLKQQQVLSVELAQLLQGKRAHGDLLKGMLCSLSASFMVGGMVTTAIPPYVHGPIIFGAGATAFKTFKCDLREMEEAAQRALDPSRI